MCLSKQFRTQPVSQGLQYVFFEGQPSFALVSEGAECLLLDRELYRSQLPADVAWQLTQRVDVFSSFMLSLWFPNNSCCDSHRSAKCADNWAHCSRGTHSANARTARRSPQPQRRVEEGTARHTNWT